MTTTTLLLVAVIAADTIPATDGRVLVIIATLGCIGTIATAWIPVRRAADRAKAAQQGVDRIAESVGEVNGHGTVQDATRQLLDQLAAVRADVRSMHTTVESLVVSAATISDRLKAHDREHAEHRHRLDNIEKDRT